MTATITVRRNVRSTVSALRGALVRLTGDIATVLDRETGKLVRCEAATLVPTKGRPISLVRGLCRADVDELLGSDDGFVREACVELFVRQTADEREALATRYLNRVGFRADDARRGSMLAGKTACAWTAEDYAVAREVCAAYSGTQLWDLASLWLGHPGESTEAAEGIADVMADLAVLAANDASR